MAQSPIKTFDRIEDIYPTDSAVQRERVRWQGVIAAFSDHFGRAPSHIVRAPGRVNVLGEHIDYSLFPVLPAAIEQDILIALSFTPASSDSPSITIHNTNSKYPSKDFRLVERGSSKWVIEEDLGSDWTAYAKASIAEIIAQDAARPMSMEWLVDGVIPEGAGLSSSAAFTVSAVLATLLANGQTGSRRQRDVVKLALASEHRLGLVNGGMDQAASVFCLPGQLLHLSFYPDLSTSLLPLPTQLALVITNSLEPHALSESAPERYNLRVFENLCAVRLLLRHWNCDEPSDETRTPSEVGRVWLKHAVTLLSDKLGLSEQDAYRKVLEDAKAILGADERDENGWTLEEIIQASGMSKKQFEDTFTRNLAVRAERFHLYKRTKHTIEESLRVIEFHKVCDAATLESSDQASLARLGQLINASHDSLKGDYDCTVASVDLLQQICLECGSLGSRQTGGGWGGAVVSLVPTSQLASFLSQIRLKYPAYKSLSTQALDQAVFATAPGCGAGVFDIAQWSG